MKPFWLKRATYEMYVGNVVRMCAFCAFFRFSRRKSLRVIILQPDRFNLEKECGYLWENKLLRGKKYLSYNRKKRVFKNTS